MGLFLWIVIIPILYWGEREMMDIRSPKKSEINQAVESLQAKGKSLQDMVDDPYVLRDELVRLNPKLEIE